MISEKDIEHLAALSRISLSKEAVVRMQKDIAETLEYVSSLQEISIPEEGTTPEVMHRNILREDGVPDASGIYTEDLLTAAPRNKNGYVVVKKIL